MYVLIQYISPLDKKIKTQLLKLLVRYYYQSQIPRQKIFSNLLKYYIFRKKKEISIKNIVGMA